MTRVRVESFTVSLDGYGAGPDQDITHPLGVGGTDLHQWLLPTRTLQRTLFGADGGTNTDQTLGERCDIADADFFQRATFVRLLDSITLMNFVNVRADAVYVVPGNDRDGLAELEARYGSRFRADPGWSALQSAVDVRHSGAKA